MQAEPPNHAPAADVGGNVPPADPSEFEPLADPALRVSPAAHPSQLVTTASQQVGRAWRVALRAALGPEGTRWAVGLAILALSSTAGGGYTVRAYFEGVEALAVKQENAALADKLRESEEREKVLTSSLDAKQAELDAVRVKEPLEVAPAATAHDLDDEKVALLRSATHEVWFTGATFAPTSTHRQKLIRDALERGVRFHFLIADPNGKHFGANAEMFGQQISALEDESRDTLNGLATIRKAMRPEHQRLLEVRYSDHVFIAGTYIFDPYGSSPAAIAVPHVWGVNAPDSPAFLIRKGSSKVLDMYIREIERLWSNASTAPLAAQ